MVTSGSIDYLKESEKYKPKLVKTLLIAESPPSSCTKYFYVPKSMPNKNSIKNDRSLASTIFYHYFKKRPETKEEYIVMLIN